MKGKNIVAEEIYELVNTYEQIGASNRHKEKVEDSPILKEFNKEY